MCFLSFFRRQKDRINLIKAEYMERIIQGNDECAICLEKLQDKDCIYMNNCLHVFHHDCYMEFKNCCVNQNKTVSCPYCNTAQ